MSTPLEFKDDQHQLCQIVVISGFLTNPNVPGCEKVCDCQAQPAWLTSATHSLLAADVVSAVEQSTLASPESFFRVKGWSRSVVCLSVLLACFDRRDLLEVGSSYMFDVIFGSMQAGPTEGCARELWPHVWSHAPHSGLSAPSMPLRWQAMACSLSPRTEAGIAVCLFLCACPGVALGGSLRRRPNCFNLLHQLEFLCRNGLTTENSARTLEAGLQLNFN